MDPGHDKKLNSLVPASTQSIVRAGVDGLAQRGLQELAVQGVRWTRKQVFSECPRIVGISSLGLIATDWKNGSEETHSIAIHNPETEQCSIIESEGFPAPLDVPASWKPFVNNIPKYFAWSPCGRYLLTLSGEYDGPLRLYDAVGCQFLGVLDYDNACRFLAWSPKRSHVATAAGWWDPSLSVWDVEHNQGSSVKLTKRTQLDLGSWLSEPEGLFNRYSGHTANFFQRFGDLAFSPDGTSLAALAANRLEYPPEERVEDEEGDAAEEEVSELEIYSIVAFDVKTLRQEFRVEIPCEMTSINWANNGHLIVCCGGEVYSIPPKAAQLSPLPIQADICRCHPVQNICAFGSQQWPELRSGSDDRLFVASLGDLRTIAEKADIGGIRDIAWSVDGKTLYAVSGKDDLWVCSLPLT